MRKFSSDFFVRKSLLTLVLLVASGIGLMAQEYIEHKVKWYEDAQTICNRHGVSMDELLAANSLLTPSDIQPKMIIKIPKKQPIKKLVLPALDEAPAESTPTEGSTTGTAEAATDAAGVATHAATSVATDAAADGGTTGAATVEVAEAKVNKTADKVAKADTSVLRFSPQSKLKVGLALPLKSAEGGSENYMDFYGGALLALEETSKAKALDVELKVLDIQEDTSYNSLADCHFVIGPVSRKDLQKALSSLPDTTWVVSPLDPRCESLAQSYPNLIQAPTPTIRQWENSIQWLKKDYITSDKLVVLYQEGGKKPVDSVAIQTLIDSCGIQPFNYSYTLLTGRDVADSLVEKFTMVPDAVNRVLIFSDNQSFVNDAVRNLRVLVHNGCKVVLYGPSRIKSFDTIEVENLHSLSFRMSSTYHINYDEKDVQNFLLKYRAIYNTEPTAFSFQGYDLMKYMLLSKSGLTDMSLLQSSFLFKKQGAGWINNAVREVVYGPGYSIITKN